MRRDSALPYVIIAFVALMFAVAVVFFIYNRYEHWHRKLERAKKHKLLYSRLQKNWSKLLTAEEVDGLSRMPEKWQSGIVPVRSETGAALSAHLQSIANKISTRRCWGRRSRLLALKKELNDYAKEHIEPFFAERDAMYISYLREKGANTGMKSADGGPSNTITTDSKEINSENGASVNKHIDINPDGIQPWPTNSTRLCRQIMFLLRDLDNMFKKGYDQRWSLRIMEEHRTAYTEWMTHRLPQVLSAKTGFKQDTSDVFDLYRQAVQAHSYYNKVCKRIAKQTKAEWHPGPLKKMFRILEKAEHVQLEGDDRLSFGCSKIFDIVRGTLIYDTLGDEKGGVLCGIRALFECPELKIIRVKDRFSEPTSAGWRDVLLNARMVLSNGLVLPHIVEVQLHQRDLREERMNVGGHYIYERHRALFEACEMVYGDEASEKLKDLHNHSALADVKRLRTTLLKKGIMAHKMGKVFKSLNRVHPV